MTATLLRSKCLVNVSRLLRSCIILRKIILVRFSFCVTCCVIVNYVVCVVVIHVYYVYLIYMIPSRIFILILLVLWIPVLRLLTSVLILILILLTFLGGEFLIVFVVWDWITCVWYILFIAYTHSTYWVGWLEFVFLSVLFFVWVFHNTK